MIFFDNFIFPPYILKFFLRQLRTWPVSKAADHVIVDEAGGLHIIGRDVLPRPNRAIAVVVHVNPVDLAVVARENVQVAVIVRIGLVCIRHRHAVILKIKDTVAVTVVSITRITNTVAVRIRR